MDLKSVIDRAMNDEAFAKELQSKLDEFDGLASNPQEFAELNAHKLASQKAALNNILEDQPTMTTNYCALIERLLQGTMTTNYCALIEEVMESTKTKSNNSYKNLSSE